MASEVKLDLGPLRALRKNLIKDSSSVVRVGVLESTNARQGGTETNASIGFKNEKGSRAEGIPQRSFLEMPLMHHLKPAMEDGADFIFADITEKDGLNGALERLGFTAQAVIQEAFDTQGFGQWPNNAPMTIALKGGRNTPLIDTTQLRKSITSEVTKG